jgi:hypothetical protein
MAFFPLIRIEPLSLSPEPITEIKLKEKNIVISVPKHRTVKRQCT